MMRREATFLGSRHAFCGDELLFHSILLRVNEGELKFAIAECDRQHVRGVLLPRRLLAPVGVKRKLGRL